MNPVVARHATHRALDDATLAARFARSPWLFLLDVDGTLAPIAARPEEASVPASTRAVLARLCEHPDVHIALVTGRAAADAHEIVGLPGLWIVGNHGIETVGPHGEMWVDEEAARFGEAMGKAVRDLRELFGATPGIFVEDKRWTLSVHYRLADPAVVPQLQAAVDAVAASCDLRVTAGKMVLELRPPVVVHKGTAALALARRLTGDALGAAILCAGDDRTDEDMFETIRAAAPWSTTVRVRSGEPGDAIETSAEFLVDGVDGMRHLLGALAAQADGRER